MTNIVIVHIQKNDAFPTYHVIGDDVRLFMVDDNAPHDRVYEWTARAPAEKLSELIPDGTEIGSQHDDRHKAIAARILGQQLTVVPKAP